MEELLNKSIVMSLIEGYMEEKEDITPSQISNRLLRKCIYVPYDVLTIVMKNLGEVKENDG